MRSACLCCCYGDGPCVSGLPGTGLRALDWNCHADAASAGRCRARLLSHEHDARRPEKGCHAADACFCHSFQHHPVAAGRVRPWYGVAHGVVDLGCHAAGA